jgi:dihydropteroate synthase
MSLGKKLPLHLQLKGQLMALDVPKVMAILNCTPDSFYTSSRVTAQQCVDRAGEMIAHGAHIIDLGGQSTRPGAVSVSISEEMDRVMPCLEALTNVFPNHPISIDTYFGEVAAVAVEAGASMINDVSAGTIDATIWDVAAKTQVPYVLMHMQGVPAKIQDAPIYEHVTRQVFQFLSARIIELRNHGVADIVVDPGFGFGKTLPQNFQLLRELHLLAELNCPLLIGLSRKKMIQKTLQCEAHDALNGTTAAHMLALMQGAHILRVHDTKEAIEAIKIFDAYRR